MRYVKLLSMMLGVALIANVVSAKECDASGKGALGVRATPPEISTASGYVYGRQYVQPAPVIALRRQPLGDAPSQLSPRPRLPLRRRLPLRDGVTAFTEGLTAVNPELFQARLIEPAETTRTRRTRGIRAEREAP